MLRTTLDDIAEAMLQAGVKVGAIERTLRALGVPEDRVKLTVQGLPDLADQGTNDDLIPVQEELERQKIMIESLKEEVDKLSAVISRLPRQTGKSHDRDEVLDRIELLEAKLKGLLDAIGEYAPHLARKKSDSLALK